MITTLVVITGMAAVASKVIWEFLHRDKKKKDKDNEPNK